MSNHKNLYFTDRGYESNNENIPLNEPIAGEGFEDTENNWIPVDGEK